MPSRPRPKVAPAWCQKPWQKPGTPPDRAWLRHGQSLHGDATRRAGTRPQTYPFVSYCLNLEHCPAAAPRHRAHCARVPPSGSPFPPEPNAYRRHAPRPRTRWEAIRLNLTDGRAVRSATRLSRAKRNYGYWYSRGLAPRFSQTRRKTTHSCVSAPPSRPSIITVSMVSRKRAPHTGEAQGKSYGLR